MTAGELTRILANINPNSEIMMQHSEGTYVPIIAVQNTKYWHDGEYYDTTNIYWLDE